MACASELTHVSSDYVIWQVYDPAVKAELFSTAVRTPSGIVIVDPIPLADEARSQLDEIGGIAAVLLTNANHVRAARAFASDQSMVLPAELIREFPGAQSLTDSTCVCGLNVVAINGAAPGEFALHDPRGGGTLIIGDALINFEPHGFALLPAKYCTDQKKMMRSLRCLLDLPFTSMFFAHGYPITTTARHRLAALLAERA